MSAEQVPPVIECFCQILTSHGFSKITSETFRQAKFDDDVATVSLWRLIYELIHFDADATSEDFDPKTFAQTPKDEIVHAIKRNLFKRGYTYEHFLSLDGNMQSGSRHLLVCVGWLIYHLKFAERCMTQCLNAIFNSNEQTDTYDKHDLIEQIKQALDSNSKVRSRLQTLEQNHICDNDRRSSFEVQLRQYPHLITEYLTELNDERRQLRLFVFWNKHENIFWRWMESVLDQPAAMIESDQQWNATDVQHLTAEKEKFHAAIDTLDSALVRLEQLWISNDDHDSIEQDVSMILVSIDRQISSLFNQLLNASPMLAADTLSE